MEVTTRRRNKHDNESVTCWVMLTLGRFVCNGDFCVGNEGGMNLEAMFRRTREGYLLHNLVV